MIVYFGLKYKPDTDITTWAREVGFGTYCSKTSVNILLKVPVNTF